MNTRRLFSPFRARGFLAGLGLLTTVLGAFGAEPAAVPPVEIGSRLELFVDHFLIDRMTDMELKLHEPQSAGTVFHFDQPWEGVTSGYATVFQDGDLYRMYYRGSSDPGYTIKATVRPDEKIVPAHPQFTCYAESRDGINWVRPKLGLHEFNGSKDNNIIWVDRGSHNFSPFLDANPAAPADQRYKAVASSNYDGDKRKPILIAFISADGIHWRKLREEPIITDGAFDSLNVVFWDSVRQQYTAIYRDFDHGLRTIKYASSKDFITWTKGVWGEFGDSPPAQLYTNATVAYARAPHIYLALPRRFQPFKTYFPEMHALSPGSSDAIFMSSRDGVHWGPVRPSLHPARPDRAQLGAPRQHPGPRSAVQQPGEISFYIERDYTFPSNRLERMTIRTDGFVSAHTGYPGGEFVTKPFIFTGTSLVAELLHVGAGQHPGRDSGCRRPADSRFPAGGVAAHFRRQDRGAGGLEDPERPHRQLPDCQPGRKGHPSPLRRAGRGHLLVPVQIGVSGEAIPPGGRAHPLCRAASFCPANIHLRGAARVVQDQHGSVGQRLGIRQAKGPQSHLREQRARIVALRRRFAMLINHHVAGRIKGRRQVRSDPATNAARAEAVHPRQHHPAVGQPGRTRA